MYYFRHVCAIKIILFTFRGAHLRFLKIPSEIFIFYYNFLSLFTCFFCNFLYVFFYNFLYFLMLFFVCYFPFGECAGEAVISVKLADNLFLSRPHKYLRCTTPSGAQIAKAAEANASIELATVIPLRWQLRRKTSTHMAIKCGNILRNIVYSRERSAVMQWVCLF